MRRLFLPAFVLMLLPATALAGGWATVGVDSTPAGVKPGGKWKPKITVLQHGRTPLEGVQPAVVVTGPDGVEKRFEARPTQEPGVYVADVAFPAAGTYDYKVDDGFGNAGNPDMHSYAPVEIKPAAAAPAPARTPAPAPDDGFPWLPVLLAAGGAIVAAIVGAGLVRRRRGPVAA